jgi:outer membrane protein OmpA-like peptidoglycan-associated protein
MNPVRSLNTRIAPRALAALLGILLCAVPSAAEEFRHAFVKGDRYRVLSRVDVDVYINRRYSHSAEILNRITFSVEELREDGAGLLAGNFSTSERYEGGTSYVTERFYESRYWQRPDGRFEIENRYYMPVVRHVPTFPARDLKPGDTWNAPGEERHDFREGFGIAEPYVIPIDVRYRYRGEADYKGKPIRLIEASYTVFYRPEAPKSWTNFYPLQIAGYSDQLIYWDHENGGILAYEEDFKFVFDLSNGNSIEYRGKASAEVIEAQLMDRGALSKQVEDAMQGLKDVKVTSGELGVTISLENIQFEADSARMLPGEKAKIERIAALLGTIPERDLLVAGHTALAGTAAARAELSRERARTVAELLIALGARQPDAITVIGYGAERPIAENATEAGRSRNRRVEITILEN